MLNGTESILVCCGTGCIANGALGVADAIEAELAARGLSDDVKVKVTRTGCSGECEQGPIVRFMPRDLMYYRVKERDAAAIVESVNERFGDFVQAFQNVVEVDIAPRGCSKGKGVLYLRDYMKQHWGTVKLYGIGDSMNDLPLLDAADVSYTFPYAPELVQKRATKVVPTIVDALLDSMNDD
jgi:(2Fe-2S) ferredoxin